jgi:hypothetical protein
MAKLTINPGGQLAASRKGRSARALLLLLGATRHILTERHERPWRYWSLQHYVHQRRGVDQR